MLSSFCPSSFIQQQTDYICSFLPFVVQNKQYDDIIVGCGILHIYLFNRPNEVKCSELSTVLFIRSEEQTGADL